MAVSNRIRAALTTTVLATAATGFMAGCGVGGEDEEEQVAYCTDENGEIVDDDFCDDNYSGGAGPLLPLPRRLPAAGCRSAPAARRAAPGSTRATRAARQRAGLPASGKVTGGTRVSGGIGSGVGGRSGTGAGS